MFVSLKEEVKQCLLDQVGGNAEPNRSQSHVPDPGQEENSNLVRPQKKQKDDLRRLLSSIQGEKKGSGATPSTGEPLSRSDKLKDEYQVYEKCQKSVLRRIHFPGGKQMQVLYLSSLILPESICALLHQNVLLREFSVLLA